MADTERTLAELQTLLADNTEQQIGAQDLRDFLVSALMGYGSIFVSGGVTPQALSQTPATLTAFTTDGDQGVNVDADVAQDRLVVNVAGKYEAHLDVTFSGTIATTFAIGVAVAGSAQPHVKCEHRIENAADVVAVHCSGVLTLSAGQAVTAHASFLEAPAGQTITVKHASLWLKRIG